METIEVRIIKVNGRNRGQFRPAGARRWHRLTVSDAREALRCAVEGRPFFCITREVAVKAA